MDPFTAGIAFTGFLATVGDRMQSGADPTQSAIVETHVLMRELHERVGNMEGVLLKIYTDLGNLPEVIERKLKDQTARVAETAVWARIVQQHSDHKAMQAAIERGQTPSEQAVEIYNRQTETNLSQIRPRLNELIAHGPYSLHTAVLGAAAETHMNLRLGRDVASIKSDADGRIQLILDALNSFVAPEIRSVSDRVMAAESAITAHFGDDDTWKHEGHFFRPELSSLLLGTGELKIACVGIFRPSVETGIDPTLYGIIAPDAAQYEILFMWSNADPAVRGYTGWQDQSICGGPETLGFESGSTLNQNIRRLEEKGIIISQRGRQTTQLLYDHRAWKRGLSDLLGKYNSEKALYNLLVTYDDGIRNAVNAFQDQFDLLIAEANDDGALEAFSASLDDLGSDLRAISGAESAVRAELVQQVASRFREASENAQRAVAASRARHERVIRLWEKDEKYREFSASMRMVSEALATMKVVADSFPASEDEPLSEAETQASRVQETHAAPGGDQTSTNENPSTELAGNNAVSTLSEGGRGPAGDMVRNRDRYERMTEIRKELAALGGPTGDPRTTPLTRQEELLIEHAQLYAGLTPTDADRFTDQWNAMQAGQLEGIGSELGRGNITNAAIKTLIAIATPQTIADTTPDTIREARGHVAEVRPYMDRVERWRFPPSSSLELYRQMTLPSAESEMRAISRREMLHIPAAKPPPR